jgi:hypothetical protein
MLAVSSSNSTAAYGSLDLEIGISFLEIEYQERENDSATYAHVIWTGLVIMTVLAIIANWQSDQLLSLPFLALSRRVSD